MAYSWVSLAPSSSNSGKKGNKKLNYIDKYKFWLENEYFDQQAKEELRALAGDKEEIKDRFYKTCSSVPEVCAVKSLWAPTE